MTEGEKVRRIVALRRRHYNNKDGVFDGRVDLYLTGLNAILGK